VEARFRAPGLGSALDKGALLSTTAQPGWLGGYLTNSALLLGCAEMLVLSVLMGQERATAVLRPALGLLLVLNALVLFLLCADVRPALARIYSPRQLWQLGLLTLGGGTLVPLCLVLVSGSPAVLLAAVLLLVLGSLAIRFVIIRVPHALADHAGG
jgi:hypothetical protein